MKKKDEKLGKNFGSLKNMPTFAVPKRNNGVIAQLVEQRTENPCVPGSIPGDTTKKSCRDAALFYFCREANYKNPTGFYAILHDNHRDCRIFP